MIILGIHDGHNSSAALIKDGQVIAALAEERLTNVKNQSGLPIHAITTIFEQTKISPSQVEKVAISSLLRAGNPLSPSNWSLKIMENIPFPIPYVHFFKYLRKKSDISKFLNKLGVVAPISFVEHHLAHAANAYFQRPWKEKTLILTLDGAGDGLSATVSIGSKNKIRRISSTSYYDSISNNLYSEVTGYLGLKRWEHEYKLMGMAPYGNSQILLDKLKKVISLDPSNPLQFKNLTPYYARGMQKILRQVFREQRFDNIAAATQKLFEELVVAWVKNSIKHTKINNLVCSGGSFLNVKTNQLIREMPEVSNVYFDPTCDDVGTSVGAALYLSKTHTPLTTLYLGKNYTDAEIVSTIKKTTYSYSKPKNLPLEIAKLLANGSIVAHFDGKDEFGPRALGNRSILADPRDSQAIRKLNFAIKMRDFWMPFAAAILEEDMSKYLKQPRQAPFMIESFDTTPKAISLVAGLHPFDLTCRPQTVNSTQNQKYYQIIKQFKKITGVGAVLNTSFNLHGFPIVGTPQVALETFTNSGLDALVLGPYLIKKRNLKKTKS